MATCTIDLVLDQLSNATDPRSTISKNPVLQAAYCASQELPCFGLCPNPDITGLGVRHAFFIQVGLNWLLIYTSPSDAAAGTWSSAVLTAALVIPAIIQKAAGQLTLHHSVLVLNYATLITVASLAIAPKAPIWRRQMQRNRTEALQPVDDEKVTQGRKVLAIALIIQVSLQWGFAIYLFLNPNFSQEQCSESTIIIWLLGPQTASHIDSRWYWLWGLWMLWYLALTAVYSWIMVVSCGWSAHNPVRNASGTGWWKRWWRVRPRLPGINTPFDNRWKIILYQSVALLIVGGFMLASERQLKDNHVLPGETTIWTFSQIAAILLAVSPAWPLYKAIAHQKAPDSLPQIRPASHRQSLDRSPGSPAAPGSQSRSAGALPTIAVSPPPRDPPSEGEAIPMNPPPPSISVTRRRQSRTYSDSLGSEMDFKPEPLREPRGAVYTALPRGSDTI